MRPIVLGSVVVFVAISVCVAETLSPVQAWQIAMSRKLTASASRENHACGKRCPVGRAVVGFVVHRDGAVTDVGIVKSSGRTALDESVVRAVRAASPLPPMPPDIAEDTRKIRVPIRFSR